MPVDVLRDKVKEHNEKYGESKGRVTLSMLEEVYDRGIGAYETNPSSVRPNVKSPQQWAMGRVNNFLRAIRQGKFRSGKHDTDLLPKKHPMSTRKFEEDFEKAEYQGRDVKLNSPFRLPTGSSKKFGVYVKDGDNVKRVTFGDPNMEIRRDDPEARSNFRARHQCDTKSDKTTAGYWSCRMWDDDISVTELLDKEEEIMSKVSLEGSIFKMDDEERVVYGWASVISDKGEPVVDTQGDIIPADELVKASTNFMLKSRTGKQMHVGRKIGDFVHSFPLTNEFKEAFGIQCDKEGWLVAMKVYDDEAWDRVKKGEFRGFSIGGKALRSNASK